MLYVARKCGAALYGVCGCVLPTEREICEVLALPKCCHCGRWRRRQLAGRVTGTATWRAILPTRANEPHAEVCADQSIRVCNSDAFQGKRDGQQTNRESITILQDPEM